MVPFKILSSTKQAALNILDIPISICGVIATLLSISYIILPEENECYPPVIIGQ